MRIGRYAVYITLKAIHSHQSMSQSYYEPSVSEKANLGHRRRALAARRKGQTKLGLRASCFHLTSSHEISANFQLEPRGHNSNIDRV